MVFDVQKAIESILNLTKSQYIKYNIAVNTEYTLEKAETLGYANEFKHVVLNIINNARGLFAPVGVNE